MLKLKISKHLERGDSMGLASLLRKEGLGHGTLIQLHQLVTTELSIEQYPHIQLVVKALEKLSENEKSLQALLLSGLTSKILWWYESVFEKLTCDLGLNPALKSLTEAFFDYFLELAKPSVPVSELRVILMYLCRTALDPTVTFRLRLEAIRTFNSSLESCGPEQRKVLQGHHDIACILSEMAAALFTAGDYELQASITETLCRLTLKLDRPIKASEWFTSDLGHAFQAIRNPYFEADCRHFLNFLNNTHGDQRRVYTFPCLQVFLDSTELSRPKDEDMEEFWVDFNLGSECVSFFVDDPNKKMFLWESIHVMRDEVNRYSLTEVHGVSTLVMDLTKPMNLESFQGQRLVMKFKADLHQELGRIICRILKKTLLPVSFMRTYRIKPPKKKLRVLPLSSASSDEDSVLKSPMISRAEMLFDQIQHSTPISKCGVSWGPEIHGSSSTSTELGRTVRKKSSADSGYLSEHTVNPSTESMTSRAQQKEDAELMGERLALDAGDMFTDELGPSAERHESNKESSGEEEVAEVKLNVEEAEVIAKQAAVAETGRAIDAESLAVGADSEADSEADGADSDAEGKKSQEEDEGPVAEQVSQVEGKSVMEQSPTKLEPAAKDLKLTNPQNSTAPALGSERTEEARDNTDVIGGLKSQIEQQISSQWEEVENQVTQSHKHMMELLSAFQERRAVQVQMLENAVWNWKALEEFHSITSGITSFMKAQNQRVMSFCQQQILRLKSAEMEQGDGSTVKK